MAKNIIFFDIDGTIISEENHTIPSSAIEAMKTAREKGNLLFINTGRTPVILPKVLRDLKFDGYVCGCGTYIEYNNEVLLYTSLGKEISKDLVNDLRKYNLDGILEGRDNLYFNTKTKKHHPEVLKIMESLKEEGFINEKAWDDTEIEADKLIIFIDEKSNFKPFFEKYNDKLEFIKRSDDFYEIIPKGYSKATGIQFLIDHLDIPFENTYAIGDSTNDLSMLKYVKNSIAMGNSNPVLFDLVSYVTTTLDDNGIKNALAHFDLI